MRGLWLLIYHMVDTFRMVIRCLISNSVLGFHIAAFGDLVLWTFCDAWYDLTYVNFFKLLQTDTKKISAVSIFFETMPYRLDESTGYIDYDQVRKCFSVWTIGISCWFLLKLQFQINKLTWRKILIVGEKCVVVPTKTHCCWCKCLCPPLWLCANSQGFFLSFAIYLYRIAPFEVYGSNITSCNVWFGCDYSDRSVTNKRQSCWLTWHTLVV